MMMTMIAGFFRRAVAEPEAFIFGPSRAEQAAAAAVAVPAE
jgi:hypothetical protein